MSKKIPPFVPIAWHYNDRIRVWQECDDSPMPYHMARQLLMNGHPGHIFAQRRDDRKGKTFLVWKPSRFMVSA